MHFNRGVANILLSPDYLSKVRPNGLSVLSFGAQKELFSQWLDALKLLQTAVQIELVKDPSYNSIRYTFRPLIREE